MKEKIINLSKNKLEDINVFIDDVFIEEKENIKTLYIVLDTKLDKYIDLDTVVSATNILNKIVDKNHLVDDIDVLDIYAKERGDV